MVSVVCEGRLPAGMSAALVEKLARLACARAGLKGRAAMTVAVIGDDAMRRLNARYRGKRKTTDVLSFGYGAGKAFVLPESAGPRQLGDVFISLPQVRRQAKRIGRTTRTEFALMVVHGTLHLLGFDHETASDERRMFGLQHDILIRAGML